MKKRILSMLMCAMLMLGLFPTTAFAEEQLSAPTGLAWDTSTEGIVKIKWDAVAGTNGYSYQLYKDGEQLPWASTRDTSADVTDILRANGSGTYMFWVSCEGEDGSQLSDWSEYSVEYTYISTVPQLATPTRLAWDENITGKAIWTAVDNASSYEVVFYRNGVHMGVVKTTTTNSFDFSSDMAFYESSTYTFTVKALSDDTNYSHSEVSEQSEKYQYTSTKTKLDTPTGLAWDTASEPDKVKITWTAVENATDYNYILEDNDYNIVKSDSAVGTSVDVTGTLSANGCGIYTFVVIARGNNNDYINSDISKQSGEYDTHSYTAETANETYLKSPATCTEPAVYYKSCSCGESSEGKAGEATFTSGNANGHSWVNGIASDVLVDEATCTTAPAYRMKCDNCEELHDTSILVVVGEPLGHDMGDATCTAPSTCKRIGCTHTDGEALGHKDDNKDHICDNGCGVRQGGICADSDDANHTCDYCGEDVEGDVCMDVNPKDHTCDECGATDMGTHADVNKDHNCDYGCSVAIGTHADGADGTHNCDYCGKAVEGDLLVHTYGTDWKFDGDNHWHECTCGDKKDTVAHTPKTVNAKEATTTEKGYTGDTVCEICEYRIAKGEDIPIKVTPTEPDDNKPTSPQTGDNSNMFLWAALLFVSGFGLVGATVLGKKRKVNK